jgi:hypothetical protein
MHPALRPLPPAPPNCPSRGILDGGGRWLISTATTTPAPKRIAGKCGRLRLFRQFVLRLRVSPPSTQKPPFRQVLTWGGPARQPSVCFPGTKARIPVSYGLRASLCLPLTPFCPLAKGTARCTFWGGTRGGQSGGPKNGPLSPPSPHRGPRPESNVDRLL